MKKQKYLFTRDEKSKNGFFSSNRASTDALNALSSWASKNDTWKYKEIGDMDDEGLIALLYFPEKNQNEVSEALKNSCLEFGIIDSFEVQESI